MAGKPYSSPKVWRGLDLLVERVKPLEPEELGVDPSTPEGRREWSDIRRAMEWATQMAEYRLARDAFWRLGGQDYETKAAAISGAVMQVQMGYAVVEEYEASSINEDGYWSVTLHWPDLGSHQKIRVDEQTLQELLHHSKNAPPGPRKVLLKRGLDGRLVK